MRGRNPFDEIEELLDRMSRGVGGEAELSLGDLRSVSVDIADRGEEFVVTADLPGFEKENIDLHLTDEALRISATRETEEATEDEEDGGRYIRKERQRESIDRRVPLPEPVDETDTSASYHNGVLQVTLAKLGAGEESKQIEID